ncbi:endonuclease/exonuclease/phosphatase family protein [Fodinibius sp. Rm-B-1B1-1]|uniref:endonuclease/exonuclease/phosphatase family protein n=1 Tax=Fodinibius alkaliphilus TaxID=3140241 RepID=UPI00315A9C2A
METILFGLGIFLISATLLPFIPKDNWWIRGFDFPRLQIVILSLMVMAGYLFYSPDINHTDQLLLSILAACTLYQGYMIYPYTIIASPQVEHRNQYNDHSTVSLMCSNVQMTNRNTNKLKKLIKTHDPDILLVIETDECWLNELQEVESSYPHHIKQPQDNQYGMALYSKFELHDSEINFWIEDDIPSIKTRITLFGQNEVILYGLHPRPPFITGNNTSTERDAELLIVGKKIKDIDTPVIVMGDMNDVAWSKTNNLFQKISGLLDPRIGRGFYNTFHAQYPFVRFSLDHFFHSNHFRLVTFQRLEYIGSDHFPVYIKLSYEQDADIKQEEPESTDAEETQAKDKIKEGT